MTRAQSRTGELNIASLNIRSLLLLRDAKAGDAVKLLPKRKVLDYDIIGLQEMRRPGWNEFAAAVYHVFCGREDGSSGQAGLYGMELAVMESIIREATGTQELTNECLMSTTFNLAGKYKAIIFVAYGPTGTVSNTREHRDAFWVDFCNAVSRVYSSDYLFFFNRYLN